MTISRTAISRRLKISLVRVHALRHHRLTCKVSHVETSDTTTQYSDVLHVLLSTALMLLSSRIALDTDLGGLSDGQHASERFV